MGKREREIVSLDEHVVGLLFNEFACETREYEKYFDEDGDPLPGTILDEYSFIEETVDYTDLGKSYQRMQVIVQRLSDGKYFKGYYNTTSSDNYFEDPTLTEVFYKDVTTRIYE